MNATRPRTSRRPRRGEHVPELRYLAPGTDIYSHGQSLALVDRAGHGGDAAEFTTMINIHGNRWVWDMVKVEIREMNRRQRRAAELAGF